MKVVSAIDSLKGSLSSAAAGLAAAEGIRRVYPNATTVVKPVADGGEGTVDALVDGMGGHKRTITATDPLGRPIACEYGVIESRRTAVMEMAAAAGITLVTADERDPLRATTYGVGEMIRDAIGIGCRHFIIGIGGSATNDGGAGMLQALGFDLLDADGKPVAFGAEGLRDLASIGVQNALPELRECTFHVACDVTNPLCGENGCSAVYGPQKGATATSIRQMDAWLGAYAEKAKALYPESDANAAGAGAAGGIGFAFLTFLNGRLMRGIELVLSEIALEEVVRDADVVVTGEGRLDNQTVMGKTPVGVAAIAKRHNKPVVAFSGCVTAEAGVCNAHGIDAFFPILRTVCTLEEALDTTKAAANMADTAEQAFRLIKKFAKPEI